MNIALAIGIPHNISIKKYTHYNMHSVTSNAVYPIKEKADYLFTRNQLVSIRSFPTIPWQDLPSQSTSDQVYFKEWFDYLHQAGFFDSSTEVYIGMAYPNYLAMVWGFTYGGSDVYQWSLFYYMKPDNPMYRFGYRNGNWFLEAVA